VVIEVSDDGAGIAVEKIRQKAIERGLITPQRAAQLAERELLQLILPGFSTAAAVTNVSGRGVGMDVVRTNVEKIGGKVEIDSRAGKGAARAIAKWASQYPTCWMSQRAATCLRQAAGLAHNVLPLNAIVPEILRIVSRTRGNEARELLKSVV
jgi:hypothetical protein